MVKAEPATLATARESSRVMVVPSTVGTPRTWIRALPTRSTTDASPFTAMQVVTVPVRSR